MMYLIYVNELGPNYKGDNIYEFIFSDDVTNIWGEMWESKPSNGYPSPPDIENIKKMKTKENVRVLFNIYETTYQENFVYCVARTKFIQQPSKA